jgi:hypothetical protein
VSPGNGGLGFPTGGADERHVAALVHGYISRDVVYLGRNCGEKGWGEEREIHENKINISKYLTPGVFTMSSLCSVIIPLTLLCFVPAGRKKRTFEVKIVAV